MGTFADADIGLMPAMATKAATASETQPGHDSRLFVADAKSRDGPPSLPVSSRDLKVVAGDFLRDVKGRPRRSGRGQLIAEIAIQSLEIIRQVYRRTSL